MPVHNADVAAVFDEIADLLEIEAANPFRVRAYRNAARAIQAERDLHTLVEEGEDLTRIHGIGKELAAKIEEIVTTGRCRALEKLRASLSPDLTELLKVPGLGPKRVHELFHELNIETVEQLYDAAGQGRIRELRGFGEKTETHIREALEARAETGLRLRLADAEEYAEPLLAYLRETKGVKQAIVAGSYRRRKETVGDLDILVTASRRSPVMDRFTRYDEVSEIVSAGTTRATVHLRCGLQVDLRVVGHQSYGAALYYFTGSRAHNIAVRRLAQQLGLKINEYGVFRGDRRAAGDTEESVFAAVGLPFIAPELRENRGEIEAAKAGILPELVTLSDLKGDLHVHTRATEGQHTIREMAVAAKDAGLQYLAITDHSRRLRLVRGLDQRRLLEQMDEIDALNEELDGVTILKGIEVDILADGRLDLPDPVLGKLDIVVGAVHSALSLSPARQTDRLLRAMDHPHFNILAHPTGRLLCERDAYDVDMTRVMRHARERGCFLELNAQPKRLDLRDIYCEMAKEEGVLVSINSDAHSTAQVRNLRYGVDQARRGWLEKDDVLNTRSLPRLRELLSDAKGGAG